MPTKSHYATLGVSETASADEIKKAYRKLAKKFHPDATGGDKAKEARFKEISEAYEILGDDKKRRAYDTERKNPFARGGAGFPGAGGGFPGGGGATHVDLGDLFAQFGRGARGGGRATSPGGGGFADLFNMFGGSEARRAPQKGEDVLARLDVDLPEAALGAEKVITVDGRTLKVKIPAGVTTGKTIRLAGQGSPGGRGAPAGDLLIEIVERPHPRFRRREPGSPDIEVEVPVPIETAVLGGKAEASTLEGTSVTLTVPPGTSSGKKLRMRGKGAATQSGRGDLYGVVSIHVPADPPARAKELIAEFARLTKK
jgi:DnaJ-class molecular chaperone